MGAAEAVFRLDLPRADGTTLREYVRQLKAAGGRVPEGVPDEAPPPALARFLAWFFDLSERRGQGFAAPLPISWHDLDAWARLRHLDLEGWEIDTLMQIDRAYLAALAKRASKAP